MKTLKQLRVFFSLDPKTMLLFLEAFVYLGWARFLLYLPFKKVVPALGLLMRETPETILHEHRDAVRGVSRAIGIVSTHAFWECKCLVKAIAGLKMLERRRIESTLYLGTAKDEAGEMIAHAWLRSGPFYITGADVKNRFIVVGMFGNKISNE